MRWRFVLTWTQWALPLKIWWWPVRKDLAFGVQVGPFHVQLVRRDFED